MENQEWFRDIENIISEYFNQHMNNNQNNTNSTNPQFYRSEDLSEYRLYLLINEFMQDYYANIRLYQENVRDMIQLLREFRTNPQRQPHTNIPNMFRPSRQSVPATTPTPPQIPREQTNVPSMETTAFTYFIQPFMNDTDTHIGMTAPQIENAIETIVYDESMSTRYNDSDTEDASYDRCPICLEDFQLGEEVCRIRVCGHIFKRPGLMYWFGRNNHCPVCRRQANAPSTNEDIPIRANEAVNNLIQNHVRNPFMREFNSFIQNVAENNRNGRTLFSFLDISGNRM